MNVAENLIAAVLGKAAEEALETAVQAYLQKKISREDFQTALLLVIVKMMGDMNKKLDDTNKKLDDVDRKLDNIGKDLAEVKQILAALNENVAQTYEELAKLMANLMRRSVRI